MRQINFFNRQKNPERAREQGIITRPFVARIGAAVLVASLAGPSGLFGCSDKKEATKKYEDEVRATLTKQEGLHDAARLGHITEVRAALQKGADINERSFLIGDTALMEAIERGHTPTVKLLLATKGIDVNATNSSDQTALMYAARTGEAEIVTLLLKAGANVNATDSGGWSALLYAVNRYAINEYPLPQQHEKTVEELVRGGADVNVRDIHGWSTHRGGFPSAGATPLMIAAFRGNTKIVEQLISPSSDINAKDDTGLTALAYAVYRGRTQVAKLLIERGADVNTRDNYGRTALEWAHDNSEIANMLRQHGAIK